MENQNWQFRDGDTVVSSDGEKIGKLRAIEGNQLIIEKGWLFPTEFAIPVNAINTYDQDGGNIQLNVSKDQAMNSGWDTNSGSGSTYYGSEDVVTTGGVTGMASSQTLDDDLLNAGTTMETTTTTSRTGGMTRGDDTIVVPVHEETLEAVTTPREAGAVRINKEVITEDQTLTVPVTEEKVNITRQVVDRDTVTGETAFRDETIEVPLERDEVSLRTRGRVAEEVQVSKETVQREQDVTGRVRREVVNVENNTDEGSTVSNS